jgi:UPF0271 protein
MTRQKHHARIDLNADLGEGFPNDVALLDRVTSASIACGAHAGAPETIRATLEAAAARRVTVGAHPGYADRTHFGRRELRLTAVAVEQLIVEQVEYLTGLAAATGVELRHVKPHGALYNQAQHEDEASAGVIAAMVRLGLPLLGQPGTLLDARAGDRGVRYVAEGFPDRRYRRDGGLVSRSERDAILQDPNEVEAQVVRLVGQGLMTLCIHGDDPRAVANADTVRAILERQGIGLGSFA